MPLLSVYRSLKRPTYFALVEEFVVAAREKSIEVRENSVEATTTEHAIAKVASALPRCSPGTVLEAWPKGEPEQVVRFTI